jgi:hypothetical protein
MSNTRQSPDSSTRADRGERLTAAGVIAAYIHEISGRHLDERMSTEPSLGAQPAD